MAVITSVDADALAVEPWALAIHHPSMNQEERFLTFERGVAALHAVLAADEAASSERPDEGETLLFLRDVVGLSLRLEMVLDIRTTDRELADMTVLGYASEEDEVLQRCERVLLDSGPYRESPDCEAGEHIQAVRSLRALLDRYANGEFIPARFQGTDHPSDG